MINLLSAKDGRTWDESQVKRRASFLQSYLWGSFQDSVGSKPHFLMEKEWSCLLLERRTPLGNYLFAPYGPTLSSEKALSKSINKLASYAKEHKFDWLTIEPVCPGGGSQKLADLLIGARAQKSDHNREPDLTRIIDLTPAQEDILAAISQSTRSYIRKNQRENFIEFKTSTEPGDVIIFTQMLQQVTRRKKVHFFPDNYFQNEANILMPGGMMFLEIALANGNPVASALIHDYGKLGSYTFAASLPEARGSSASALLLWQAMINAKNRGKENFDLFGIAPDDAPAAHPWAGFTSFKKKFGGEVVKYAGTWDIPISGRYRMYRTAKSARKILRRH